VTDFDSLMATAEAPKGRRRRGWAWIVVLVVFIGLVVGAWFLVDSVSRSLVASAVQSGVNQKLNMPADHEVDVQIEGAMIPQLIKGSFDDVTVSSDGVPVNGTTADVTVHAQDIAYRGDVGQMSSGTAVVTLDENQLRGMLGQIDGIPVSSIGLKAPNVTATTSITLFGQSLKLGLAMTPTAKNGALVLTPATITLGGSEVSASDLKSRFGSLADSILAPRTVCLADKLPKGLTLTAVKVAGDTLVADLKIAPDLAVDSALQQKGTCS
jgi:hypothetical protein